MAPKHKRDSILKEAWDHMSEDFARVLPASLAEKLGKHKWGWKGLVLVTLLELAVLGVLGTFLYNWLTG